MADGGCVNSERMLSCASGSCDRIPSGLQPQSIGRQDDVEVVARVRPASTPGAVVLAGDRYEVGALLGRGGSGEVYRGLDRALRRQVAIKVLHGGEMDARRTVLFDREVRLLLGPGIGHPRSHTEAPPRAPTFGRSAHAPPYPTSSRLNALRPRGARAPNPAIPGTPPPCRPGWDPCILTVKRPPPQPDRVPE